MELVSYYIMASSYRKNIYLKMDEVLKSDFIIGEQVGDVKEMDLSLIKHQLFRPNRITFHGNVCYDKGVLPFIRKNKYDTLILGGDAYNITVWLLLFYCKLKGIKVIMWTHGYYGRENKLRQLVKKIFFSFANRLWVYGEYAKKLLASNHIFAPEKIDVVYNSLDYDTQLELRHKTSQTTVYQDHFKNNNQVLVFIGRLTFSKKLYQIIQAVELLKNKGKKFNVVLIGDGEAKKSLEEQSGENVWFYGKCFDENILAELIYNADLCVSPGEVGLTAIHSMMFGCPVVTHKNYSHQGPEFEAIVSGETGGFFIEDNIDSLAETIDKWFENCHDRKVVRQSCFSRIDKKYNPYVQIKIMQESLNKLK